MLSLSRAFDRCCGCWFLKRGGICVAASNLASEKVHIVQVDDPCPYRHADRSLADDEPTVPSSGSSDSPNASTACPEQLRNGNEVCDDAV